MRYGFDFKILVLNSLEQLSNKEARAYTVSEVFSFFLKENELKPDRNYQKSFRKRTWKVLKEWCEVGWVSYSEQKHPRTKAIVGYYKIENGKQQITSGEG